ncbi:MAG: TauD/TfdA family dioxygenase [Kangiellaceae bacterium]
MTNSSITSSTVTNTTSSKVQCLEKGLICCLRSSKKCYFNYFWLRDNCPTSFDSTTQERSFDLSSLKEAPKPKSAEIIDDNLHILWQNETHRSVFALEFLREYSDGQARNDIALVSKIHWFKDYYDSMQRFDHNQLIQNPTLVQKWAECLLIYGVSIVTNMPKSKTGLLKTASLLGHVRSSFFGETFEVKIHPSPVNLAYTANALEMHTDLPAEELAPGIQYLHCLENSVEGGNSLFLDGAAVAEDFRSSNPKDFALLSQIAIPFFCKHDDFDMRARQKVIELGQGGEVTGLTISGHLKDIFDHDQSLLDQYYPALWRFGHFLNDDKYLMKFRLNAGECIVFDNHRIVHGRESYESGMGARHLRGCYTDMGELRSTYRSLHTKHSQSNQQQ